MAGAACTIDTTGAGLLALAAKINHEGTKDTKTLQGRQKRRETIKQ